MSSMKSNILVISAFLLGIGTCTTYKYFFKWVDYTRHHFAEKNKNEALLAPEKSLEPSNGEVQGYYTQSGEAERLFVDPIGIVERLRTESIINRYAPKPPAVVYDIGGGAGVYAFPLAQQGYAVHLVDLTSLLIEQAKKRIKETGIQLAECTVGDARNVQAKNGVADIVLLLGPLYHLQKPQDRLAALKEAYRILKPGGVLFAAAISRFAAFSELGTFNLLHDQYAKNLVEEGIKTGNHNNPKGDPKFFTTAYSHRPDELKREVQEAGFGDVKVCGIQGTSFLFASLKETVADKGSLETLLYFLKMIEEEPSIIGASTHIMAIGKKK